MRWYLNHHSWSWLWFLNTAEREVSVILFEVVVLRELVHAADLEDSSVGGQGFPVLDLIAGQVAVPDKLLTWLVHVEGLWQSLPSQVHGE